MGAGHKATVHELGCLKNVCYMHYSQVKGQGAPKLPVYVIPAAIGHVYDISVPDSFMYTCYRICT